MMAMIVTKTCSLVEKGPGLSDNPRILTLGKNVVQALPTGNESS